MLVGIFASNNGCGENRVSGGETSGDG